MAGPAAPPGFAQGLLSSLGPWMTGDSPSALDTAFSRFGGFQGLLDAMAQDTPGSQGVAAMGRAMEQAQNNALYRAALRQQLAQGTITTAKDAMSLPLLQ